jgi:hypothetical protein
MLWVDNLVNSKAEVFVYCVNNRDGLSCLAAHKNRQLWLVYTSETWQCTFRVRFERSGAQILTLFILLRNSCCPS